ncbi:MAG TPA: DUF2911 domain-containing protein [Terriglobia bacterium]|nr:DUF2911 domain-containing protein [Terriglobia bacterium]
MKRIAFGILGVVLALALAAPAWAQRNPRGTAKLTLDGKTISVEYGRPSLNGRAVGDLLVRLKPGDVWRLGADQSTTFSTTGELSFGHVKIPVTVPAGEYSLWVRKETENKWSLVFNKQHGQSGDQHYAAEDFASAPLEETKASNSAEQVTITLAKAGVGGTISIQWGDLELTAPVWSQRNPRGTARLALGGKTVWVEYGRPSLNGRVVGDLLAGLKPGEVWRLGADQSTTFSTTGGTSFGEMKVPAGEYSLWARKETENKWSLVFNRQQGIWGTEHDAAQDFASAPLEETKASDSAQKVTITLAKAGNGGTISIQWGDMNLTAGFR